MGLRLTGMGLGLAVFATGASAHAEAPKAELASSSFSLSAIPASRTPGISSTVPPSMAKSAMPRELPEVREDYARPIPGVDWRPARGALVRLRPAKLRFNLDF